MNKNQDIFHAVRSIPKRLPLPVRMVYGRLKRKFVPHPFWDNEEFKRYYEWLQETQWWTRSQLEELQLDRLRALVKHAYENVPYYRRVFDERRLKPKDIVTLGDLQKLPLLSKEEVRNNFEDLIARNIDRERLRYVTTGGSTGRPLGLYQDKYTTDLWESAFIFRQWSWAGFRFGDRRVTLRGDVITRSERKGKRPWWDYNTDNNELVLSSMAMSEENMSSFINKMREFNPKFIHAFPSSLEIFARFLNSNKVNGCRVNAVFCESETVYPHQREAIESQFKVKIFAGYGLTERAADAVECERHEGYHVSMEYGILELLGRNNEPIVQPGVLGRVVGTGFDTYCMPFIRYVTDDLAIYAPSDCSCRRQATLIKDFKGRIREFVVSKSGHLVSLSALNMHEPIGGKIREYKFRQEREGELTVEIAKMTPYAEKEVAQEFLRELYRRLNEKEFNVRIVFVGHVSRTERGKIGLLEQKLPLVFKDLQKALT